MAYSKLIAKVKYRKGKILAPAEIPFIFFVGHTGNYLQRAEKRWAMEKYIKVINFYHYYFVHGW